MKLVNILLSTYNGEKYIEEQLDSILNQSYPNIKIYIRDDGSTDRTVEIIKNYIKQYSLLNKIEIWEEKNIGILNSFLELINRSSDSEYWALCDQDDVWFVNKIDAAIAKIQCIEQCKGIDEPILYSCKSILTDEKLYVTKDVIRKYTLKPSFGNSLIENICPGCTMVFNHALYNLIKDKYPKNYLIHDMWLYQVATCFGTVYCDKQAYMFYRQHSNNAIGLDSSRMELVKRQIKNFNKFKHKYSDQMVEFLNMFSLDKENKYLVKLVIGTQNSWKARFKILFEKRIFRQGKIDNFIFKCMLFSGLL